MGLFDLDEPLHDLDADWWYQRWWYRWGMARWWDLDTAWSKRSREVTHGGPFYVAQ